MPADDVIVRYLLDELPEEEQSRLEERAFTDPRWADEIRLAEYDLIDEYVRGGLSDSRRQSFERLFLASAERRRKVEFARALSLITASADEVEAHEPVERRTWAEALRALLRPPGPALRFAMAAGVVLAVAAGWLVRDRRRLQNEIGLLEAAQARQQQQEDALRQEAVEARAETERLSTQLDLERRRLGDLSRASASSRSVGSAAEESATTELFLPAENTRTGTRRPRLVLPEPTLPRIRLRAELGPADEFPSYRVVMRTADGREVWRQDDLRASASPSGRVVEVTTPAGLLGAGRYELALEGLTTSGVFEQLRFYDFEVTGR